MLDKGGSASSLNFSFRNSGQMKFIIKFCQIYVAKNANDYKNKNDE